MVFVRPKFTSCKVVVAPVFNMGNFADIFIGVKYLCPIRYRLDMYIRRIRIYHNTPP